MPCGPRTALQGQHLACVPSPAHSTQAKPLQAPEVMASKVAVPQAEEAAPASPEEAPAGVPGAAFYAARLQRAAALPPAQRSCDVAAFLECDRLLGLAADLLNSLSVAAEQEDRPRAALGLLAYLCGTAGELALGGRRWSAPRFLTPLRLTPAARLAATWLVTLWEGRPAVPAPLALLLEPDGGSEAAWGSAPPLADLLLLLKVLAYCASVMGRSAGAEVEPRLRLCHKLVRHALRSLTEPANGAVLAAQLQQAQRSADAAGASWQLPDAAALAWLAARLEVSLCTSQAIVAAAQQRDGQEQGRAAPAGGLQASDEGAVQARRAAAVERFAELCPDSPLACDLLAGAARCGAWGCDPAGVRAAAPQSAGRAAGAGSRLPPAARACLPRALRSDVWMFNNPERAAGHLRRGLALAQEQVRRPWHAWPQQRACLPVCCRAGRWREALPCLGVSSGAPSPPLPLHPRAATFGPRPWATRPRSRRPAAGWTACRRRRRWRCWQTRTPPTSAAAGCCQRTGWCMCSASSAARMPCALTWTCTAAAPAAGCRLSLCPSWGCPAPRLRCAPGAASTARACARAAAAAPPSSAPRPASSARGRSTGLPGAPPASRRPARR